MTSKVAYLGFFNWILYVDLLVVSLVLSVYVFIAHTRISELRPNSGNVVYFVLADRNLHFLPASLTYFGAFISSITVLGIPSDIYLYGISYIFIAVGYTISSIIACVFFNPVFYDLKILSVYEYIGLRFSRISQIFCAMAYIIQMLLYLGIVLYVPSLAFSLVVDINKWVIVLTAAFIATIYTTLGGLKAVVYTTVLQTILLFIGLIPILIKGTEISGGISNLWKYTNSSGKANLNLSFDIRQRCTVPSMIIGGTFVWMGMHCATQTTVQRINSCRTKMDALLTMIFSTILTNILLIILFFCGLILCFKFHDSSSKPNFKIHNEALIVQFVLEELKQYPGVLGLFLVSVMSASLSAISAGLNSMSAATLRNIFPILSSNLDDSNSYLYLRFCTLFYGLFIMWFAYLSSLSSNVLYLAYSIFSLISGPILGVFIMGISIPMCNFKGAFFGHLISQLVLFWLLIGNMISGITYLPYGLNKTKSYDPSIILNKDKKPISGMEHFYAISIYWYSLIGCLLTIIMGMLISIFTKIEGNRIAVPSKYITPLLRGIWKDNLIDNSTSIVQSMT